MKKAILLCLFAVPVFAQEPAGEPEPETEVTEAVEPEPEPASPPSTDSPFDYEATEQVSEDKSISFPVDI